MGLHGCKHTVYWPLKDSSYLWWVSHMTTCGLLHHLIKWNYNISRKLKVSRIQTDQNNHKLATEITGSQRKADAVLIIQSRLFVEIKTKISSRGQKKKQKSKR